MKRSCVAALLWIGACDDPPPRPEPPSPVENALAPRAPSSPPAPSSSPVTPANPTPKSVPRDVEDRPTISRGVYGHTTSQDDVGANQPVTVLPLHVEIFAPDRKGTRIADVRSDETGFYQVALDAGPYSVCTSFGRCTTVRVEKVGCLRLDYEFSAGPGWSRPKAMPCAGTGRTEK